MNRLRKSMPILLITVLSIIAMATVVGHVATADTPDSGEHILLVGHGIPAADFPKDRLREFFQLSAKHHAGHENASEHGHSHDSDELKYEQLERQVRAWPRTPENDPYKYGTEAIAEQLRKQTNKPVWVAYNEFCDPTVELMIDKVVAQGARRIVVVSTMLVSGGGHSEKDIPNSLAAAGKRHPEVEIIYAWPYDAGRIATLLTDQIAGIEKDQVK